MSHLEGARRVRLICAVLSILSAGCVIGQSLCLASAIVALWQGQSLASQIPAILGFLGLFCGRAALSQVQDVVSSRFSLAACRSLRLGLLRALLLCGPELAQREGEAACVLDVTDGIERVESYLEDAIPKEMQLAVIPICLGVTVLVLDPLSGVIALICLPVIMVFMRLIGHTASDDAARRASGFAQMSNHFMDALRGLSTLRLFGHARSYSKAVFQASEGFRRHVMRTLRVATLSSTVLDIFATCGLAAVAIMLGFRMVDGDVSFFPAMCVLLLVPEFFMPIRSYAKGYHATLDGKSALDRAQRILMAADGRAKLEIEYESVEDELELTRALKEPRIPDISLQDVSISYGRGHVLKGVSASLSGAHMVVITGRSGAGKTSLLNVLSGFADPASGTISVNGWQAETLHRPDWLWRVAYIPQHPHIFNATLRENVSCYFPEATDEQVSSALASVGLAWLAEEGLGTMLGEGGRALSGGEAHRIALARALVDERRDVVVLDEPTAHLDIQTESAIRDVIADVFADRLVIIATHRLHWVRLADVHIKVADGRVETTRLAPTASAHRPACEERAAAASSECVPAGKPDEDALMADAASGAPANGSRVRGMSLPLQMLKGHWSLFAFAILLSTVASLFAGALMFTSGYMISVAAAIPLSALALHLPSIFVRIFGVGKPLIDYVERLSSHDWVLRATSLMRKRLFSTFSEHPERLRKRHSGDVLSAMADDISNAQDLFIRCILPLVSTMLLFACIIILASALSAALAVALFVLILVATIVCGGIARASTKRLSSDIQDEQRLMYRSLSDMVYGLRDVILSGRGREATMRIMAIHSARARLKSRQRAVRRIASLASQVLLALCVAVCLGWAAHAFAPATDALSFLGGADLGPLAGVLFEIAPLNESPYPPNWIAAFAIFMFPLMEFFGQVPSIMMDAPQMEEGTRRLASMMDEHDASPRSCIIHHDVEDPACALEVRCSSVSYPGAARHALEGVELDIQAGSKTAIIGKSGAGKTTLARLMSGELAGGDALVRRRGSIGFIEQDAHIFNKTLRENLLIANGGATDSELEEALRRVGLGGLLDRLPNGLDEVLAAEGANVSGGEATRITVARALLAGFDTIILDEPFRALDPDTEAQVMDTIMDALSEKTVIIITHHLQGIDRFDEVIFLEDGRVSMLGTPAHLREANPRFSAWLALEN